MKELYDKAINRLNEIKDYSTCIHYKKVKFHTIWECEFDLEAKKKKYPEVDPELKPIDKKDAFYGGRTDAIQLYNTTPGLKAKYVDFRSLYPWVNKFCKYPIEHPETFIDISVQEYLDNEFFGIMKLKYYPLEGYIILYYLINKFLTKIPINYYLVYVEHV